MEDVDFSLSSDLYLVTIFNGDFFVLLLFTWYLPTKGDLTATKSPSVIHLTTMSLFFGFPIQRGIFFYTAFYSVYSEPLKGLFLYGVLGALELKGQMRSLEVSLTIPMRYVFD